jgi:hypothetical protein
VDLRGMMQQEAGQAWHKEDLHNFYSSKYYNLKGKGD